MSSRGISGFSIIFIIILLMVIGFIGYKITRVHFTNGTISALVEESAELGLAQNDYDIIKNIIAKAKENNVEIDPDSIFIDHAITDSFRIYVTYRDSSNIFGLYTYSRRFVIDKIKPIKVRF